MFGGILRFIIAMIIKFTTKAIVQFTIKMIIKIIYLYDKTFEITKYLENKGLNVLSNFNKIALVLVFI